MCFLNYIFLIFTNVGIKPLILFGKCEIILSIIFLIGSENFPFEYNIKLSFWCILQRDEDRYLRNNITDTTLVRSIELSEQMQSGNNKI